MTRRDFFAEVTDLLHVQLADDLRGFRHHGNSMLLKIDYGNERVHFEVWPDSERGHLEIGLHFEDGPASTLAYLAFFDAHIVEIKHLLGAQMELERWTLSWGHLYETIPLGQLNQALAERVSKRLTAQITLLQPMVAEAAVAPERRDRSAATQQHWTRRYKR